MLPSRRLLQVLPRRTFTTSLPRLSPVRCQKAHSHPHPPPTQRTALLLQQHPSHCGVQIRQNSTEATKKTSTTDKKIPPFIQSGDWMCSRCQAHNYRTRTICFECQSPIQEGRVFYMEGSWNCPTCSLYVPHHANHCKRCMTKKDTSYEYPLKENDIKLPEDHSNSYYKRKGDWICQQCGQNNKARSVVCEGCESDRKITPQEELLGDWQCNQCKAVNYAHRKRCVSCSSFKPKETWEGTPKEINENMNTGQ